MSANVSAKRGPLAEIEPIKVGNLYIGPQYESTDTLWSASLKAIPQKGNEAWKTLLYSRPYDIAMERDVQQIGLRSMKLVGSVLHVVDEWGSKFEIEAKSGKLLAPLKARIYERAGHRPGP